MDSAPDAIRKLYTNDDNKNNYSFKQPVYNPNTTEKLQGTNESVPKEQSDNLRRSNRRPYKESKHIMDMFLALDKDHQEDVAGIVDEETQHITRRKGVRGTNLGILRNMHNVTKFNAQAKERADEGKSTNFYVSSVFWRIMRMGQVGDINPQNSKLHRALFSMVGWDSTFKIKVESSHQTQNDAYIEDQFMGALALAFDIESSKLGGPENQRIQLQEFLKQDVIFDAIVAITKHLDNAELTTDDMDAIVLAVKAGKTNAHALRGLVEYARYRMVQPGEDFTTDLFSEIDGVANGIAIGMAQLIPNSANMQDVAAGLVMTGHDFIGNDENLDKLIGNPNLLDAYERMGQLFGLNVVAIKNENSSTPDIVNKINAVESIIGELTDDNGYVNKIVRGLAKPRTMQTVYGATKGAQIRAFAYGDIINDNIYGKLQEVSDGLRSGKLNEDDANAELRKLFEAVNTLVRKGGKGLITNEGQYKTNGKVDSDKLINIVLSEAQEDMIYDHVKDYHGEAMWDAVAAAYKSMMDARAPYNKAINISILMYNAVFKAKVDALKAKRLLIDPDNTDNITVDDIKEITKSIENIFPKVRTPFYNEKSDTGYLPVAGFDRKQTYSKENKVHQTYTSKTVPEMNTYAEGISLLADPGVAPMVSLTLMMDGATANKTIGSDVAVLNVHDAGITGINRAYDMGQILNENFTQLQTDYYIGNEVSRMIDNMLNNVGSHIESLGSDASMLMKEFVEVNTNVITNEDIAAFTGHDISEDKPNKQSYKSFKAEQRAFLLQGIDSKAFVRQILADIKGNTTNMAKQNASNKDVVMNAVMQMAQYSHEGVGATIPEGKKQTVLTFDNGVTVDVNNITSIDISKTKDIAKQVKEASDLVTNSMGSAGNSNQVSTDINDYPDPRSIDSKNAVEVLDSLVDMDNDSSHTSIQESPAHLTHLRKFVGSITQQVMKPIDMYIGASTNNNETMGRYTESPDGDKIWIQTQKVSNHKPSAMLGHGLRMSNSQVYAHEMVHHITETAITAKRGTGVHLRDQLIKVYEASQKAFESKYGANAFRVFLNDPYMDITDPANKFEVQAAKERWDHVYGFKQDGKTTNRYSEFMAIGTTNENFMRELAQVEVPTKKLKGLFETNLQTTIVNIFNKIMDFIQQKFKDQQHSNIASDELQNLVLALSKVDSQKKNAIWAWVMAKEALSTVMGRVADVKIKEKTKKIVSNIVVVKAVNAAKTIPELDNMMSQQMRNVIGWYNDREYGIIPSIITEMKGATSRLQPFHDLLGERNMSLDAAKESMSKTMRDVINGFFNRKLESKEKVAINKGGIKTDLSSLLNYSNNINAIKEYVTDSAIRNKRIKDLELQIASDPDLIQHRYYFSKAADALGYFMVTNRSRANEVSMHNAHNIVVNAGVLSDSQMDKVYPIVDQLATLRSLNYITIDDRSTLGSLLEENPTAILRVLEQHNILKRDALHSSFYGKAGKMGKGYTKAILNARTQFEMGTLADEKYFADNGYVRQQEAIPRDPDDHSEPLYMYVSKLGTTNSLQPGIISYTTNKAMGASAYDVLHQTGGDVSNVNIQRTNAYYISKAEARINEMRSSKPISNKTANTTDNYMVPKFDDDGVITEMRYIMSETTKDNLLEQHNEVDAVLGGMAGQIIDKRESPKINSKVIVALKELFDTDYDKYPEAYVEISPFTKDKRLKEIYEMIPPAIQNEIKSVWGSSSMFVPKDVIDLVFGNRKYSIIEMFGKDRATRSLFTNTMMDVVTFALGLNVYESKGRRITTAKGRAMVRAKNIEDFMKQLTQLGKSNIVIRNLSVTRGNYASNMAYLKSKGISLERISEDSREAIVSALRYQKDKNQLDQLILKLSVEQRLPTSPMNTRNINKIKDAIVKYEHLISLNPSTPMMEAGLMPSIVDDVDTDTAPSIYKFGLDKGIDTVISKLPGQRVRNVSRTLFMTEDTEGYKILNNAVKMTDYVGRYVLYNHYTKDQNVPHDVAIGMVNEEFINFSLPTHKMIEYGNNIGLIWFSKYQLRVLKQIKNLIAEGPFTTLATFILGSVVGTSNVLNSIPLVTKDLLQAFADPATVLAGSADQILLLDIADTPFD